MWSIADYSRAYDINPDLSKSKRIILFKWEISTVLLWAYREGLYTNLISELNVNDNIIRINMWILREYSRIMLL
jgi:tmRNA-binding protein